MTATPESWDTRIQRAEELAGKAEPTKEILTFYATLLQSQKEVDEFLRSRRGIKFSNAPSAQIASARD